MPPKPRVFLDTSALFAGIWSSEGGGRQLLHLGEWDAVQIVVSSDVTRELEDVIRRKAADLLPTLALLLHQVNVEICAPPSPDDIQEFNTLVGHLGDAKIAAAARASRAGFLVTLDRAHLLNRSEVAEAAGCLIGTPGDCLSWLTRLLRSGGSGLEDLPPLTPPP